MASIKVVGDAVVITSVATLEELKTLEKYRPAALCLYEEDEDGKKVECFKVGTSEAGGSINRYGATFASESRDGNGYATITLSLTKKVEKLKDYIADTYGAAVNSLNKVEAAIGESLASVHAERQQVIDAIVIE